MTLPRRACLRWKFDAFSGVGALERTVTRLLPNMMVGQLLLRSAAPTRLVALGTVARNSAANGGWPRCAGCHRANAPGTYDPSCQYNPVDTGETIAAGGWVLHRSLALLVRLRTVWAKGLGCRLRRMRRNKTEAQRLADAAKQRYPRRGRRYSDKVKGLRQALCRLRGCRRIRMQARIGMSIWPQVQTASTIGAYQRNSSSAT